MGAVSLGDLHSCKNGHLCRVPIAGYFIEMAWLLLVGGFRFVDIDRFLSCLC